MKNNVVFLLIFILFIPLCSWAMGCEDKEIILENGIMDELQVDEVQKEGILQDIKELYESFRVAIQELLFSTPRIAHDKNLKTIDQAIELFRLVEGKDPKGIGEEGEEGTLVGEGYLESNPQIPVGLKEEEGEWSEYTLRGNPLRTWPVGDWGGYRDGDTP